MIKIRKRTDGSWTAIGPKGGRWSSRRIDDLVKKVRREYPNALIRASIEARVDSI